MAYTAEQQAIIDQAVARNPSNPQLAIWQFAQSIGYSPEQVDQFMGWPTGSTQNWAVQSGLMAAPNPATNSANKPPTWLDTYNQFISTDTGWKNQQSAYGGQMDRAWNADPDAAAQKQRFDDMYLQKLADYNRANGTNIQPDQSVLGANAQPNDWNRTQNRPAGVVNQVVSDVSKAVSDIGSNIAKSPALMAAITAIAAANGVPPAAVAAVLGGNRAAVDGNLLAGIETAAASYGLGTMVNGAFNPSPALSQASAADLAALEASTLTPEVAAYTGITGSDAAIAAAIAAAKANPNLTSGLLSLAGGVVSGNAAADAAKTQADAQIKAAQIAADAAKFKPVGVTTNFGSSQFGYDAKGNLTSAGYQLAPGLQAAIGTLGGQAQGLLNQAGQVQSATAPMATAAQRAMSLGQGYLATDPQAQAAKYLAEQQGLLAPGRADALAALQAQMQAQGRGGFAIGGGVGGQGAANPQLQALYNAQLQQDAQLAANATQGGMDYAKFGAGMVGTGGDMLSSMYGVQNAAYTPLNTTLNTAKGIESMGQNAMQLGMDLGGKTSAATAASGLLQSQGMTNAANTMAPANAYSPWGSLLSGAGAMTQNYKFDPMTGKAL